MPGGLAFPQASRFKIFLLGKQATVRPCSAAWLPFKSSLSHQERSGHLGSLSASFEANPGCGSAGARELRAGAAAVVQVWSSCRQGEAVKGLLHTLGCTWAGQSAR